MKWRHTLVVVLLAVEALSAAEPEGAHVEFSNGDILCGEVMRAEPATPGTGEKDRLIIKIKRPLFADRITREVLYRPDRGARTIAVSSGQMAVDLDRVARIVSADSTPRQFQPGTLWMLEGPLIRYKAIKWNKKGFTALTDTGMIRGTYGELQEYHAKDVDTWKAILADVTVPCPDPGSPLVRFEFANGTSITTRRILEVSKIVHVQGRHEWIAAVPRWALGSISFDARDVKRRSERPASEVPLSTFNATAIARRSFTGFVWPWRIDKNVRGGELRIGNMRSTWGVGMHSYTALAFDLPASAKEFTSWVGLDNAVGNGGCVKCGIFGDNLEGPPLWQSGYLRGSDEPVQIKPLNIEDLKRLILVADFGHEGRPEKADPMDIRDEVDWLMPMITLKQMPAPGKNTIADVLPDTAGWGLSQEAFADTIPVLTFDRARGLADAASSAASTEIRMTRTLKIAPDSATLAVSATRGKPGGGGHKIAVYADGELQRTLHGIGDALYTARARAPLHHEPAEWDLRPYIGKQVTLEIVITPQKDDEHPLAPLVLGCIEFLGYEKMVARRLASDPRHERINSWQISGSYVSDQTNVAPYAAVFPPEQPNAKDVQWTRAPVATLGLIDFGAIYGGVVRAAYMKCVVTSKIDRDVLYEIGADDSIKVWLNGKLIHSNPNGGSLRHRKDWIKTRLKKGRNHLLVKVVNHHGAWGAWSRLINRDGSTLYGELGFSPE